MACDGDSVQLTATVAPIGGPPPTYTYAWSTGATTQSIDVNTAGTVTVTVTNATGCTATKSVVVNLSTAPIVNLPATQGFCAGASATLNAGNAGSTILWSTGAVTPSITVSTAGTYSVTVTNILGCSTTDNVVVTENPLPVVNLGANDTLCLSQTPFAVNAGNFASYNWSNGASTSTINVTDSGTYSVTVTDINGCTGTEISAEKGVIVRRLIVNE
jgi:hypothetical protein